MESLRKIKNKIEEMKVKYNLEREEDNSNHSDGFGMYWSGFFTCLKEISQFVDTLEVKDVDLEYLREELDKAVKIYKAGSDFGWGTLYNIALHFFELGLKARNEEIV